jgi:hypothetical protein
MSLAITRMFVMPVKTGIQVRFQLVQKNWIPASAGMTDEPATFDRRSQRSSATIHALFRFGHKQRRIT